MSTASRPPEPEERERGAAGRTPPRRNPLAVWGPAVLVCAILLAAYMYQALTPGSRVARLLWVAAQASVGVAAVWGLWSAGRRNRQ
jgi:hypothetical protein